MEPLRWRCPPMSNTPSKRQTGARQHDAEQVYSAAANAHAPGSRSLQAGGWPPPVSAPIRIAWGATIGLVLRWLGIALFGLVTGSAVALAGVTIWALYGSPFEPRKTHAEAPSLRLEAAKSEAPGRAGPLAVTGAPPQHVEHEPAAPGQPGAKLSFPQVASSGAAPPAQFSGSSANAVEPAKTTNQTQAAARAGRDQPQSARTETQDARLAALQQEISRALPPRMQCNVSLCAARYKSFHATDCTYQPYGGGPRSVCER